MRILVAILLDALIVASAYFGCGMARLYLGAPPAMLDVLTLSLGPFVVIHGVCLAVFSAYDFGKTRTATDLAFSAAFGVVAATLVSFVLIAGTLVYHVVDPQPIGRSVFLAAGVLSILILPGWRVWYTGFRSRRGELVSRVLMVGNPDQLARVSQDIHAYARSGHEVVGHVTGDTNGNPLPEGFLGRLDDLPRIAGELAADEVLVSGEVFSNAPATLLNIAELCERKNIRAHILPGLYESLVGRLDLYAIGGIPLFELRTHPLSGAYTVVKRTMDVCCAVAGLTLGAPLLLAAAVAIRCDSRGPVLFRQVRSGLGGKPFNIVKLRTMCLDAEKDTGPIWASKDDPRVTRAGRLLRRMRIDEIPQLWNVLKGEMSLVGPRPERPFFIEEFQRDVPLFPLRLRVKPGITALSHVWGRYDSSPADRLRYDLVYMSNMSFALDVRIIVETVKIVLTGRGAR
jgi:exopolysaccharide biosynthesis polyprenyl glycosylphosphotransferase